jgi:UDP-N-acetylmuramoyl-L-alanyl-D-glutamate--2,6-diaminopimelate ligase
VEELAGGFSEKGYVMVESRRQAIRLAVRLAREGDILLLAGKGHEDYQIIGTEKIHFDDREEATAAFREMG